MRVAAAAGEKDEACNYHSNGMPYGHAGSKPLHVPAEARLRLGVAR